MSDSDATSFAPKPREFPQLRARRTFEALVEAGAAVFSERGFDATQTPDIAARAGVSVGSFYRYFSDKREVFLEIIRRQLSRSHEQVLAQLRPERFVGKERRHTIETALEVLLANVAADPAIQHVFLEMSLRDEQVAALRRSFEDEAVKQLAALISDISSVADPEATAFVITRSAVECAIAVSGTLGPVDIEAKRAMSALTDMVCRALWDV